MQLSESFQDAEHDLKVLTGIEVGHSTHHRQVQKVDLSPPNIKQKLTEVCLDGGKVRLRVARVRAPATLSEEKGKPCYWKEYKTGRLQGIYYGVVLELSSLLSSLLDKRLQIVGAQWKSQKLPQMLQLRCAYLNRQLAPSA